MEKQHTAYFFLFPTLVYLIGFQTYPLFENIRLSFTNLSLIGRSSLEYVGWENYYHFLFKDKQFFMILWNTLIWVFGSVFFQFVLGIPSALILNYKLRARGIWRGLVVVPWVIPVVVVSIVWKWIFDGQWGILNFVLRELNLINRNVIWLGNPKTVWFSLLSTSVWKGFPYITLMILAGLQGIEKEIYEAAKVDGAVGFRLFRHVTLPLLQPTIFVSGLVAIVTTWTKFELIWSLTEGGPGNATSTLATYIYTNSFVFYDMGRGAALAVISTFIVLFISILYVRIIRRGNV
ncbi:MAG: carbohydrate ABC transporter permease [Candidatus Caldatribacteriaceae bacterium]